MAAPKEKTLANLSGRWTMNKDLSDDVDGVLQIQGFSTITRKAIAHAPVHLSISQSGRERTDIKQSTVASIPAVDEQWILDWREREQKDALMGKVRSKSRWTGLESVNEDKEFLTHVWEEEEEGGEHVEAEVVGVEVGWRAHQVWGFQDIGGGRRFVRRVVVTKGDDRQQVKLVYDYDGT